MATSEIEIINKLGLHARAASKFAATAGRYASKITVLKDSQTVDGKSIMSLMLLAAARGTALTITCEGEDEDEALQALADLINERFGEEE